MSESGNVHTIEQGDRTITLIGTAHISQASVDEVVREIEAEKPNTVCVELCPSRREALLNKDHWKQMDIFKVIREQKTFLLLSNLILSSFQKRLGDRLGVQPGAEMLKAIEVAETVESEIVLADRDVQVTLRRAWRSLSFMEKMKMMAQMMMSLFINEEISEEEIENLKEGDAVSEAMEAFASQSPAMKRILIDERDAYLAEKIRQAPGERIVAVVGAGHVPGIKEQLQQSHDLEALEQIPPAGRFSGYWKWILPVFIIALIGYGFTTADTEVSWEIIKRWVLLNGVLAAVGAACALAHPITIASAFFAAPLTSLNPAVAAGWVSGLVEASTRKPQVIDFENLSSDIRHTSGFWKNNITRILLVVVFTNLGSALGTLISIPAIASLL